jgi:peptidoglycan/xylan/chitin deacetylase (PgdA/CDA1 family)
MRRAVKKVSEIADRVLPQPRGVVTLIYHRVGGGTDSSVDLAPEVFAQQMEWLAAHCRVLTLDEAVEAVRDGHSSADGAVVVTFDDGTADFCENAVPIILEHQVPVTLYAETGPISTGQLNAGGLRPTSWGALREAVSTGLVTIGSHTHSHRVLRRAEVTTAAEELDRSIDTIAAEIGSLPRHFAYPKAEIGPAAVRAEVARRFASAAIGGGRPTAIGGDLQRWYRTPIQSTDSFEVFQRKVHGGMRLEGAARAAVAKVRYIGARQ